MKTSLYRHFDRGGRLLYVGISVSAAARLAQHRESAPWFESIATVTIEHFERRDDALQAEAEAIRKERPLFNKKHNRSLPRVIAQRKVWASYGQYLDAKGVRQGKQPFPGIAWSRKEASKLGIGHVRFLDACKECGVPVFSFSDGERDGRGSWVLAPFDVPVVAAHLATNSAEA